MRVLGGDRLALSVMLAASIALRKASLAVWCGRFGADPYTWIPRMVVLAHQSPILVAMIG
jgi:hypothetical protein